MLKIDKYSPSTATISIIMQGLLSNLTHRCLKRYIAKEENTLKFVVMRVRYTRLNLYTRPQINMSRQKGAMIMFWTATHQDQNFAEVEFVQKRTHHGVRYFMIRQPIK